MWRVGRLARLDGRGRRSLHHRGHHLSQPFQSQSSGVSAVKTECDGVISVTDRLYRLGASSTVRLERSRCHRRTGKAGASFCKRLWLQLQLAVAGLLVTRMARPGAFSPSRKPEPLPHSATRSFAGRRSGRGLGWGRELCGPSAVRATAALARFLPTRDCRGRREQPFTPRREARGSDAQKSKLNCSP